MRRQRVLCWVQYNLTLDAGLTGGGHEGSPKREPCTFPALHYPKHGTDDNFISKKPHSQERDALCSLLAQRPREQSLSQSGWRQRKGFGVTNLGHAQYSAGASRFPSDAAGLSWWWISTSVQRHPQTAG